jgi:chromosomal replication initiation ATPase DnaA
MLRISKNPLKSPFAREMSGLMDDVCTALGVSREQMQGRSRAYPLPDARHAYICRCAELGYGSYSQIAATINRNHCIVVWARGKQDAKFNKIKEKIWS